MFYYHIAPNKVVRSGADVFTYSSSHARDIGQIVRIEVGKTLLTGLITKQVAKPKYPTKPIIESVYDTPLPAPLVQTLSWLCTYYATPFAHVLQTALPTGITKKRRKTTHRVVNRHIRDRTNFLLNTEQQNAVDTVISEPSGSSILHGVTGAGKTRVYIELAKRTLAKGRSAIILVPEIALTSQIVDEFSAHFDNVLLTHSRQTESERHAVWSEALLQQPPQLVIGPRSALFLPLRDIGLIVVDESHEPSYKQEKNPRYSALRMSSVLAQHHRARVVFGSATPSIADYYLAENGNRPIIHMQSRARPDTISPDITIVDMKSKQSIAHHRFLSPQLLGAIQSTTEQNGQCLIYHNRRGSAAVTLCESCGWQALCDACLIPFTLHGDMHQLSCNICARLDRVPTHCPSCGEPNIIHKGIGTKLIETELRRLFPNKLIMRFDGDTKKDQTINQQYHALYNGDIDIIIGTQVVAKGLDLPHLRTVGVIQADTGLQLPDYFADERTFQLIAQVVGRVGRTNSESRVIIQTYHPTHPAILLGAHQKYAEYYSYALHQRRHGSYPPFVYLLRIVGTYKTETSAVLNTRNLAKTLRDQLPVTVQILGPTPTFYEQRGGRFSWQLILKSTTRSHLMDAIRLLPPTHWQYELDPFSLL